jgi:hypothetical protein
MNFSSHEISASDFSDQSAGLPATTKKYVAIQQGEEHLHCVASPAKLRLTKGKCLCTGGNQEGHCHHIKELSKAESETRNLQEFKIIAGKW